MTPIRAFVLVALAVLAVARPTLAVPPLAGRPSPAAPKLRGSAVASLPCEACHHFVRALGVLAVSPPAMWGVELAAQALCEILRAGGECQGDPLSWQCRDICRGVVKEHAAEVMQLLVETKMAPGQVCTQVLHCAPTNATQPATIIPRTNLTLQRPLIPRPRQGKGTFAHLSDLHYDPDYVPGTSNSCGQPVCCRTRDGPALNNATRAGPWGSYNCDTPRRTLQHALEAVAKLEPEFVLWTGDDPPHNIWDQSREYNLQVTQDVTDMIKQTVGATAVVLPALGNHEGFPVNQYRGPGFDSWLYSGVADMWAQWLPEDALRTLRFGGYYTVLLQPGLRVVALNTNYYVQENFYLWLDPADLGAQKAWLEDVMQQVQQLGDKVIFIGHAPTGHGWRGKDADWFLGLLDRYHDNVAGLMFGHTHHDEFEVVPDLATGAQARLVQLIAPSITPIGHVNPAFRILHYQWTGPHAWTLTDLDQYRTDVEEANKRGEPEWRRAYTWRAEYGMPDLSPGSWQALGQLLLRNATVLQRYLTNMHSGTPSSGEPVAVACSVLTSSDAQYDACVKKHSAGKLLRGNLLRISVAHRHC